MKNRSTTLGLARKNLTLDSLRGGVRGNPRRGESCGLPCFATRHTYDDETLSLITTPTHFKVTHTGVRISYHPVLTYPVIAFRWRVSLKPPAPPPSSLDPQMRYPFHWTLKIHTTTTTHRKNHHFELILVAFISSLDEMTLGISISGLRDLYQVLQVIIEISRAASTNRTFLTLVHPKLIYLNQEIDAIDLSEIIFLRFVVV